MLCDVLKKEQSKLQDYYKRTKNNLKSIYEITIILASKYKLSIFEMKKWQKDIKEN